MSDDEAIEALSRRVLEHYEDPYHRGECPAATHVLRRESPLCGDWVRVALVVSPRDRIEQAWFDGDGCVISQAAASLLVEQIEGMSRQQVRQFSAAQMLQLVGRGLLPSRQKCCLLPWWVLQRALDSPLADDAYDDPSGAAQFGGPSLDEES
jgi:nitrogen fixation protein NifU and related proteins